MSERILVDDPATGCTYAEVEFAPGSALDAVLDRAAAASRAWRTVPVAERVRLVLAFVDRFLARKEAIALDITGQMGKPLEQARREVETMADRARYMAGIAEDALAEEVLPEKAGFVRKITREPLGVVLDIAPWNYPLLTAVNVVVPAVLAGNAVIVKPSHRTPLTGPPFARAFEEAGAPVGLVTSILVDHEVLDAAIPDPRIGYVSITGSVRAGREVYARAAAGLKGCGLELGGKDPAYVAADADLEFAAANVVDGATYNAGQSCCAVERAYVHRSRYAEFLDRALEVVRALRIADPRDPSSTLGPLALPSAPPELEGRVEEARRAGARVLAGGRRTSVAGRGRWFEATLLADVPAGTEILVEETFGPVLPVVPVDSDEEAIRAMNDSRYGLTASVWTADPERAERIGRELETGTVFLNRCDYLDPALPWTGVKESGLGCTLSRQGLVNLTRPKSWHFRVRTR